ncbi:MAG TPA: aminotransferase class V-fold PLP-dependent enzyme [Longimicrobiales bacterium]|nr:aminotransferase class V-fold PLP-dependent enzyme [Longimicrobiales bacterium]
MVSRRDFFSRFAATGVAGAALRNDWSSLLAFVSTDRRTPAALAEDEDFWAEIQRSFTVDRTIINLNNGGVSPSPRVVQDAMTRYLALSNEAPAHTMWNLLEPQVESVRRQLAASFGCDPEEMAITRNASEALEICQLGMDLKPGDEVLTTNQDYGRMLTTWDQRVRREGIVLKQISFPVPATSMRDLVDRFERAITPRTRVIHCCHITNLTGQIFPVRDIVQMARAKGVEVIVDGAHAYAHFPFKRDDLDCDYYGTSLHKWLLAPHGTGFLYVRKSKIEKLWALMAAPPKMNGDIRKFEEIGTHPAANHNAIAEALAFHETIGGERKAARLRFLRDRWMKRVDGQQGVRLLTSYDPHMSCALSTVNVADLDPNRIAEFMWKNHRILVTPIVHAEFKGIRVTPNVYTTLREIDVFAGALEGIARNGLTT